MIKQLVREHLLVNGVGRRRANTRSEEPLVLSSEQEEEIEYVSLAYLFRVVNSQKMSSSIRKVLGGYVSVKAYRTALTGSGYLQQQVKPWLYALFLEGHHNAIRAKRLAQMYKVAASDLRLARYLDRMAYRLRSYKSRFTAPTSPEAMKRFVESVYDEVMVSCLKLVSKKMAFIISSNGTTRHDLAGDCVAKGIQGLYAMYPCYESREHAVNIFKSCARNHGRNMIDYYSTESRQTLRKAADGNGFESMKLSLDSLFNERLPGAGNDHGSEMFTSSLDGSADWVSSREISSRMDDQMDGAAVLMRFQGTKRAFLELLTGEHDILFSDFIRSKTLRIPNDEWYEQCMEEGCMDQYIDAAARFVGVAPKVGHKLVSDIRKSLRRKRRQVNSVRPYVTVNPRLLMDKVIVQMPFAVA